MTRLPQLEQELVAAAARLQGPGRVVAPARLLALAAATGAVLALLALGLLVAGNRGGGEPARTASGAPTDAPPAQLEEVLGVFRGPATAADDMGPAGPIDNRQPGEDPSRSRRVEWPGETIFMWPMRDGVCYGVRSGGGCVPLDHLRRQGVSVGIQDARGRNAVSGPVVDGIGEVVLTGPGGAETRVPVRDNFFFVDLEGATAERVSWTYAGEERSFDVGRFLRDAPPPSGPIPDGAPDPTVEPLAESASKPLAFVVFGISYTAVGYHDTRNLVCVRLTTPDLDRPASNSCLNKRLLRDALAAQPAHLFAAGGAGPDLEAIEHTGFARADVVEIQPADAASDVTVALSDPWRPGPWEGAPIRFLLAVDRGAVPAPGTVQPAPLEARLEDGRVLPVP
jgi:hypothetical protein